MPVRVLHCADIHLDTAFSYLSNTLKENRQEELREVFSNIIKIIKERQVQIFLIAGDFFDGENVTSNTLYFLKRKLSEIKDVHVFITPGNHDPYMLSNGHKDLETLDNVHIFKNEIEKIYIEELNVNVYGFGFMEKYSNKLMLRDFQIEDENSINIMVTHGDISSDSVYNPITLEDIKNSKLDYLALGHIHKGTGLLKEGDSYWAYPGNPQGRSFNEVGEKGVLLLDITKGYCSCEFIKTSVRDYLIYDIDISDMGDYGEITDKIIKDIDNMEYDKNYYRIILKGKIEEGFKISIKSLFIKLQNHFHHIELVDETKYKIDIEKIKESKTLKALVITELFKLKLEDQFEEEIIDLAVKYSLDALDNGQVNIE